DVSPGTRPGAHARTRDLRGRAAAGRERRLRRWAALGRTGAHDRTRSDACGQPNTLPTPTTSTTGRVLSISRTAAYTFRAPFTAPGYRFRCPDGQPAGCPRARPHSTDASRHAMTHHDMTRYCRVGLPCWPGRTAAPAPRQARRAPARVPVKSW